MLDGMVPSFRTAMEWLIQSFVAFFGYDAIFTSKTLQKKHKADDVEYQVGLSSPAPDSPPYSYLNHERQEQASPSPLPGI